jgi:hypothetical protein
MRKRCGVGQIVGRDELYVRVIHPCANYVPTDTAETVDTYFYGHLEHSPVV